MEPEPSEGWHRERSGIFEGSIRVSTGDEIAPMFLLWWPEIEGLPVFRAYPADHLDALVGLLQTLANFRGTPSGAGSVWTYRFWGGVSVGLNRWRFKSADNQAWATFPVDTIDDAIRVLERLGVAARRRGVRTRPDRRAAA